MKSILKSGSWMQGDRLPSLLVLAGQCKVCRTTMWRALGLLQKESLVYVHPRGAIFAGQAQASSIDITSGTSTWEQLKSRIGKDLFSGAFPEYALPHLNKLALHYHAPFRTLKFALDGLSREGILSKQGHRYVHASNSELRRRSSTIVLISNGGPDGPTYVGDPRTQGVVESFERECSRLGYGYRWEGFDDQSGQGLIKMHATLTGMKNVIGYVINVWNPWSETRWQRWLDLIRFLIKLGTPIVVIDQASNLDFPSSLSQSRAFRILRIAGIRAGAMAAEYLFSHGHYHVAYLDSSSGAQWSKDRYTGLRRFYERFGTLQCTVEIFPFVQANLDQHDLILALLGLDEQGTRALYQGIFTEDQIQGLLGKLTRIRAEKLGRDVFDDSTVKTIRPLANTLTLLANKTHDIKIFAETQNSLLHVAGERAGELYSRPFYEMVRKKSAATTWVCPDEPTALNALAFLKERRIKVPAEIAVMGFENWPSSHDRQLTTYDFNMNGMVQQALLMILDEKFLKSKLVISEVDGYVVERRTTRR